MDALNACFLRTVVLLTLLSCTGKTNNLLDNGKCEKFTFSHSYGYLEATNLHLDSDRMSCFYGKFKVSQGLEYALEISSYESDNDIHFEQNSRLVIEGVNETIESSIYQSGFVELPNLSEIEKDEKVSLLLYLNSGGYSDTINLKLIALKRVREPGPVQHRSINGKDVREVNIAVANARKFTFEMSELFRFGSDEVRVTFEAPFAEKLFLEYVPAYESYFNESIFYKSKLKAYHKAIKVTLTDGIYTPTFSNPNSQFYRSMVSLDNRFTISFETLGDGVAYTVEDLTLFYLQVYPSSHTHDCIGSMVDMCKWINVSNDRILIQELNTTDNPLCMSLEVSIDKEYIDPNSQVDTFSLETIIDGEVIKLDEQSREIKDENNNYLNFPILLLQANISEQQQVGNVTISNPNHPFSLKSLSFEEGFCTDLNQILNCQFNQTICKWILRPNSTPSMTIPSEGLLLNKGMYLMSKTIRTRSKISKLNWKNCLELEVSGVDGMLTILQVRSSLKKILFRKSFLVDTSLSRQKIRVLLRSLDDYFSIFLIAKGMGIGESQMIKIFEVTQLSYEKCRYSETSHKNWNLDPKSTNNKNLNIMKSFEPNIGQRILLIECPYSDCFVNMWTSLISKSYVQEYHWFCFHYQFHTSIRTNNFCLQIAYDEIIKSTTSATKVVVWTQCSPIYSSSLSEVCIPLTNSRGSRILATVRNYEAARLYTDRSRFLDQTEVVTSIVLSSPYIKDTYEASLESGTWYQPTTHSVLWSKGENLDNFMFTPIFKISYDKMDYLKSPVFEVKGLSFICVSFKLRIKKVTFFQLSLEHFPEFHVLKSEPVASWKNEFFPTREAKVRQTFPITPGEQIYQLSFGVSPSPLHSIWNEPGYLYDLTITHSECGVLLNCTFDSDSCGWIERDTQSNRGKYQWFHNPIAPTFDSEFNEKGEYLTLFMIDNQKKPNFDLISELISPPIVSAQDICVEFCYFMNGNDEIGEVELRLDVVWGTKKIKQLWNRMGSRNGNWYKVQLPINGTKDEGFRLQFLVDFEGPAEYFVAIDSVIVRDDSSWKCNAFEQMLNRTETYFQHFINDSEYEEWDDIAF